MTAFAADIALAEFDGALSRAHTPDNAYAALQALAEKTVGVKLFTIMTVDMKAGLARRAYTSDPQSYPASGTKPIHFDDWFDIVHKQRRSFVANTLADIAKVFPITNSSARWAAALSSTCRSFWPTNSSAR